MGVEGQEFFHGLPIVRFGFGWLNPGGIKLSQIGDHSNFPDVYLASAKHWGQMPPYHHEWTSPHRKYGGGCGPAHIRSRAQDWPSNGTRSLQSMDHRDRVPGLGCSPLELIVLPLLLNRFDPYTAFNPSFLAHHLCGPRRPTATKQEFLTHSPECGSSATSPKGLPPVAHELDDAHAEISATRPTCLQPVMHDQCDSQTESSAYRPSVLPPLVHNQDRPHAESALDCVEHNLDSSRDHCLLNWPNPCYFHQPLPVLSSAVWWGGVPHHPRHINHPIPPPQAAS